MWCFSWDNAEPGMVCIFRDGLLQGLLSIIVYEACRDTASDTQQYMWTVPRTIVRLRLTPRSDSGQIGKIIMACKLAS